MVEEPRVAVAVAANDTVTEQVGLQGLLVNVAVTPLGRPDALNVTAVVVPLTRVATIDDDELVEPWTTVKLLGDGVDRLKSKAEGAATVSDRGTVWVAPPPVALIVTALVPRVAVAVAEKETVTVQVGLHGLLVKVAVTPLGRDDATAENVMGAVVPLTKVAIIDDAGLVEPWTTVKALGEGVDNEKSKPGVMFWVVLPTSWILARPAVQVS